MGFYILNERETRGYARWATWLISWPALLPAMVLTTLHADGDELVGLMSPDRRIVFQSMDRLAKGGPPTLTAPIFGRLGQLMQSEDGQVRDRAAACLFSLQPNNNAAFQVLTKDLRNRDDIVRRAAAEASGLAGANGMMLSGELVSVLNGDSDVRVRLAAARSLGQLGKEAKNAIPALIQALKRNQPLLRHGRDMVAVDDQVHRACIDSLSKIGADSPEACHALTDILADKNSAVLQAPALSALEQMGPGAAPAVNPLLALLNTAPDNTKEQIVRVFQQVGRDAAPTLPALKKLMDSPNANLRKSALEAILSIDDNKASLHSILQTASTDKDAQLRRIAITLISRSDVAGAPAVGTLVHDLEHAKEPDARQAAIKSLGNLGPQAGEGLPLLVKLSLSTTAPPAERKLAYEAIKKIDPSGDKTIGLLRPNLEDCFKARATAQLLDYIGSPAANQLSATMKSKWHL
jgi:HEAT repeat protein